MDVKADPGNTCFLAGTLSLKEENEVPMFCLRFGFRCSETCLLFDLIWTCALFVVLVIQVHLIRLSQDGTELVCEGLFSHPNEIWDLASCPFNPRLFSTVYASGELLNATMPTL